MDPRHVPAPLGGYEGDCPDTKRVSTAFYKRGVLPHSPRLFLTAARQIGCERATTIGNLNYSRETIFETFYNFSIPVIFVTLSPDYQFILNPAYNKDRGPVNVFGFRAHIEF